MLWYLSYFATTAAAATTTTTTTTTNTTLIQVTNVSELIEYVVIKFPQRRYD